MTDDERSGTVLVAHGSATKRSVLVDWLSRAGYEVLEAESGTAALARVDEVPLDLVVLDVRAPEIDGFEVCERIKSDPRHAALPVIHVAAYAVDVAHRAQGLTRGADAYLAEPIEPEELIATAHAVLRYYRARQRAEQLAKRLAQLAETTLAISSASSFSRLLSAAADGAATIFESAATVVAVTSDGESLAGVSAGPGSVPEVRTWVTDDGDVPVGSTVRSDLPADWGLMDWPEGERVTVAAARLRADRPPVYVAAPATALLRGAPVLTQLAQAIAAAVEAQRSYDEEHRIAVTLQRSLLPQRLPNLPGFEFAVRYEPASAQTEVGGDFYELAMIDGQLLVAIGDVAGHSLHAATVMAELRHAVRAYAIEGHAPGAVLQWVDELLRRLLPGELATICLLLLDPPTGRCRMASAGHPPPLLVTPGVVEFLEHRAPLLGVRAKRPDDREFWLPPQSTLVLYTDGLIERRDADIDEGLRALAASAATVEADLDRFCERLLVDLAAPETHDDIAVVALRRR